jgi:SAM-dependent methyltransferase
MNLARNEDHMSGFFAQFGHPTGPLGWLVGHLMAAKNGERSRWALALLNPKPGERVLELGFGPGVDVRRLDAAVGNGGQVAGIDISSEMVRQARARNRAGIRAGRIDLREGSATALPFGDASFDAVYATNSAQFWPDLEGGMREIRRVLRPGGRAVIVVQPMWRGATAADSIRWREKLRNAMRSAGFSSVETAERAMRPCTAAAGIGRRTAE